MISLQHRFLFVHVPKTGGNSIQNILRDYSEDQIVATRSYQDGIERFEVRNDRYDITKHSTLAHYKSVLEADVYARLFKFAAMRNPWDRMISFYFSPHRGITTWKRGDFLALMEKVLPLRHYISQEPFKETGSSPHVAENSPMPGRLGADIDYLMRFENLERDFESVCEILRLPRPALPRRNVSERGHYSQYYDEELKELVRMKFAEEIELGKYVFEQRGS